MTELKLAKLPDRNPAKMTIMLLPELADGLRRYAEAYEKVYGQSETVADLIPFMLAAFLESDRGFTRTTKR